MITIPLTLLAAHFVGDFILQSNWMALNKSKKMEALTFHCLVYSIPMLLFGWRFALLNFYFHWVTDYFTSRWTSKLWFIKGVELPFGNIEYDDAKRHWFFVVIGLDQLIHYTFLALTYNLLGN